METVNDNARTQELVRAFRANGNSIPLSAESDSWGSAEDELYDRLGGGQPILRHRDRGIDGAAQRSESLLALVEEYELNHPGRLATTSEVVLCRIGAEVETAAHRPLRELEARYDPEQIAVKLQRTYFRAMDYQNTPLVINDEDGLRYSDEFPGEEADRRVEAAEQALDQHLLRYPGLEEKINQRSTGWSL